MAMKTEFEVVPFEIEPSRKLKVNKAPCVNFHLHTCLTQIAALLVSNIKSQTNNMTSGVYPRDVSNFHLGWKVFKESYKFALDNNDAPGGSHEQKFYILLPSMGEIMLMPNQKLKAVSQQMLRLCQIILSTDAASVGANIDVASAKIINEQIIICEKAILFWVGKGKDNADVGIEAPLFTHVGEVVPDFDFDKATTNEPSPERPTVGMPDVPDIINAPQK